MALKPAAEEAIRLLAAKASDPVIEEKRKRLRDQTLLERERLASVKTRLELSREESKKSEVDRDDQIQAVIENVKKSTGAVRFVCSRIDTVPAGISRWIGHLDSIEYESLEGQDIERYIRSRWGGGRYKISIHGLDGKIHHSFFRVIAGKSKPVNPEDEEDDHQMFQIPDGSAQMAEVVKASMAQSAETMAMMQAVMQASSDKQTEMMAKLFEASRPPEKEGIPWDKILAGLPAILAAVVAFRKDEMSPIELMKVIQAAGDKSDAQLQSMLSMAPTMMANMMQTQTEMTSILIEKMAAKIMDPGGDDSDPMTKMMDKIGDMIPMLMAAKQMPTAAHLAGIAEAPSVPGHQQIERRETVAQIEGPDEEESNELTPEQQSEMLKKMRILQFLGALKAEIMSESDPGAVAESYEQGFYTLPKGFRTQIEKSIEESEVSTFIDALKTYIGEDQTKEFMSFIMEDLDRFEWIMEFLRALLEESDDEGTGAPVEDSGSDQDDSGSDGDGFGENVRTPSEPGHDDSGTPEAEGTGGEEREAHTETTGDRTESE